MTHRLHPGYSKCVVADGRESVKLERTEVSAREILVYLSGKRIETKELKFQAGDHQASGGYGDVMVATFVPKDSGMPNLGRKVAVKKLKFSSEDSSGAEKLLKTFVNEFHILDGLSHPNIIEVLGFVEDLEKQIAWIVAPWEANGNVREFLRLGEWDIPERISLIKDVSSGLDHLHSRQPPICHGDLKSLNVLVNSSYRAVITDFGSARVLRKDSKQESNQPDPQRMPSSSVTPKNNGSPEVVLSASDAILTLTGPSVSFRWASPEIMGGEDPDLASDVWALGWICWEVMTDDFPFPKIPTLPGIVKMVIRGQLPMIHEDAQLSQIRELCKLMTNCWRSDPDIRPTARLCQSILKWMPSVIPAGNKNGGSKIRSAALVLELGELHRLGGRYQEASTMFDDGLAIARSTGDEQTIGRAFLRIGDLQLARSKYDAAEGYFAQALAIYKHTESAWGQASALLQLGDVHRALYRYPEAQDCIGQALTISTDIGNTWGQMGAWYALGNVHKALSRYDLAEEAFTHALDLCEGVGSDLDRANAFYALGEVYRARSKLENAEEFLTQALATYESIGNDLGHANSLHGLGDIQRRSARFMDAQQSLTEAFNIYQSLGNDLCKANVLAGIGDLKLTQSKLDEAEGFYTRALGLYESEDDDWGRASILVGLGALHLERSRYLEAEGPLINALELYTKVEDELGRTNASLLLGRLRLYQGQHVEAKALIASASWMSARLDYEAGMRQAAELIEQIFEAERTVTKSPPSGWEQGPDVIPIT